MLRASAFFWLWTNQTSDSFRGAGTLIALSDSVTTGYDISCPWARQPCDSAEEHHWLTMWLAGGGRRIDRLHADLRGMGCTWSRASAEESARSGMWLARAEAYDRALANFALVVKREKVRDRSNRSAMRVDRLEVATDAIERQLRLADRDLAYHESAQTASERALLDPIDALRASSRASRDLLTAVQIDAQVERDAAAIEAPRAEADFSKLTTEQLEEFRRLSALVYGS